MSKDRSPENAAVRPPFFTRGFGLGILGTALIGFVILFLTGIADYNKESARVNEFRNLNTRQEKVEYLLRLHEGVRFAAYDDSLGYATGGVGHLLEGKYSQQQIDEWRQGIPESLVMRWLKEDTAKAEYLVANEFANEAWFNDAPEHVMIVLTDMTFNMGIGQEGGSKGLLSFRRMVENLRSSNWDGAADEMLDSTWRYQTGKRSHRLAYLMRHGELGTDWLPLFYLDFVRLRMSTFALLAALLVAAVVALRLHQCSKVEVRRFSNLPLTERVCYLLQKDGRQSNCGAITNALAAIDSAIGRQNWYRLIRGAESNALAVLIAASVQAGGWHEFEAPVNAEIFECYEDGNWQQLPYSLAQQDLLARVPSFLVRILP